MLVCFTVSPQSLLALELFIGKANENRRSIVGKLAVRS